MSVCACQIKLETISCVTHDLQSKLQDRIVVMLLRHISVTEVTLHEAFYFHITRVCSRMTAKIVLVSHWTNMKFLQVYSWRVVIYCISIHQISYWCLHLDRGGLSKSPRGFMKREGFSANVSSCHVCHSRLCFCPQKTKDQALQALPPESSTQTDREWKDCHDPERGECQSNCEPGPQRHRKANLWPQLLLTKHSKCCPKCIL